MWRRISKEDASQRRKQWRDRKSWWRRSDKPRRISPKFWQKRKSRRNLNCLNRKKPLRDCWKVKAMKCLPSGRRNSSMSISSSMTYPDWRPTSIQPINRSRSMTSIIGVNLIEIVMRPIGHYRDLDFQPYQRQISSTRPLLLICLP